MLKILLKEDKTGVLTERGKNNVVNSARKISSAPFEEIMHNLNNALARCYIYLFSLLLLFSFCFLLNTCLTCTPWLKNFQIKIGDDSIKVNS